MKHDTFVEWKKNFAVAEECLKKIQSIYERGSTRQVESRVGNVLVELPSLKNGRMISCESRTVEYPCAIMLEMDDDVVGYIVQPDPIELKYIGKNGRRVSVTYTPDFFVFRRGSAGWVETKKEVQLLRLAEDQPSRYQKIDGKWRSPVCEEYAARYGLTFTILSDVDLPYKYVQNAEYLLGYFQNADKLQFGTDVLEDVLRTVSAYPGITIAELRQELEHVTADDINGMIVKRLIWVDLREDLLAEPERVKVFSSPATAAVHKKIQPLPDQLENDFIDCVVEGFQFQWGPDVCTVIKVVENDVFFRNETTGDKDSIKKFTLDNWSKQGLVHLVKLARCLPRADDEVYRKYSPEAWEEASRRCKIVELYIAEGKIHPDFDKDERTLRRWVDSYIKAKEIQGDGIYGLLQKHYKKGCKKVKLSMERLKVLVELVDKHYLKLTCPNKQSAYSIVTYECSQLEVEPPSKRLFYRMIDDIGVYKAELARAGKKVAQKFKPFAPDPTILPVSGIRFLQVVHADHTPLPVTLIDKDTKKPLGSAWITLLIDSATRTICGYYLTYSKPSRKSIFMAIRDLVRRYGRMPETIVTDNGKEFHSYDYKCLAARYRIILRFRPPSEPQFGSDVERGLKTTQQLLIENLSGRTFPAAEYRMRTGTFAPEQNALWTLEELQKLIEKFATVYYDQMQHMGLFMSPKEARERSLREHGEVACRKVDMNEEFFFLTTPTITTNHGYAKVVAGRGIKTNGIWYNCQQFDDQVAGTKVQVRRDPEKVERCYAAVRGSYVPLKPHLSLSILKKLKGVSLETYRARRCATERAYDNQNAQLRGEMMNDIAVKEQELRDEMASQSQSVTRIKGFMPQMSPKQRQGGI